MNSFTRQEQKVIVGLLLVIILGFVVNEVKRQNSYPLNQQLQSDRMNNVRAEILNHTFTADTGKKARIVGRININNASIQELQTLPRIGPTLAESISLYREQHGPFQNIEDIKNVTIKSKL